MKRRNVLLTVLAVALVLSAGIGSAWAYFTTYAAAEGGLTLRMGSRTEMYETMTGWTKQVQIRSEADSEPVYIRARYFGPESFLVGVTPEQTEVGVNYAVTGTGWTETADGEGWYYYMSPVMGGSSTGNLNIDIQSDRLVSDRPETIPAPEIGDAFNVIVVYESVPVLYNEDGEPLAYNDPAVWAQQILDAGSTEGGTEP